MVDPERQVAVPEPGTDLVPDGWADRVVVPWLAQPLEEEDLAKATMRYAALEAAFRTIDADHLEITKARRYIEIRWGELLGEVRQGERTELSPASESSLGKDDRHRFRQLAAAGPEVMDFISKATDAEQITRAAVLRVAKPEPVVTPVPAPEGRFRCIVVDPPWPMQKIERDVRPNQGSYLDYPVMSLDQIADEALVPVRSKADEQCHLYLWVTHKYLPAGLDLLDKWGFAYQCVMTWRKNVGITPFSWMYDTEHVLYAHRGGLKLEALGLRLSFDAPVTQHSAKPDVFYERVIAASPGPRLEMFARQPREGFEVWGNEVAA